MPPKLTPGEDSVRIGLILRKDQLATLRAISAETGIPVSVLIRQGVDLRLGKNK